MNYFDVLEDLGFNLNDTEKIRLWNYTVPKELRETLEKNEDNSFDVKLFYQDLGDDIDTFTQIGINITGDDVHVFSSNFCILSCCCFYRHSFKIDENFRKNIVRAIKFVEENG